MGKLIYSTLTSLDCYTEGDPAVVGGGKRFFLDGVRLDLELLEERRFGNGVLILRYGVRRCRERHVGRL
jgi:hypothetical protein